MKGYAIINGIYGGIKNTDDIITLVIMCILAVVIMFIVAYISNSHTTKSTRYEIHNTPKDIDKERLKSAGFTDEEIAELFRNKKGR